LLVNATVKAVEGDTLVLAISAAPLARRLSEQRNTEVISAALRSVLGVAWQVRCEHGPGGAAAPAGASGGGSGGPESGGGNGAARQAPRLPQRPVPERPSAQRPAPTQPELPQRPAPSAPARQVPTRPSAQEPPPPEPPPYDPPFDPEYDEEDAVPDRPAGVADAAADRRDPEEVAIELLSAQLGARAVEDRR